MLECSEHVQCAIPGTEQKVECHIDNITCTDFTLPAAISLVRVNTNNMREDFEVAASSLIEVDPYRRISHSTGQMPMCLLLTSRLAVDHMELISDGILKKTLLTSLRSKRKSSGIIRK